MERQYKSWIIERLENWAETFNNNYPDHLEEKIEEESNTYNSIKNLIDKYTNGNCTREEYENVLFHIWQIEYNS